MFYNISCENSLILFPFLVYNFKTSLRDPKSRGKRRHIFGDTMLLVMFLV